MKHYKAIFLIVLGAFIMASGLAYAEQESAIDQLKAAAGATSSVEVLTAAGVADNQAGVNVSKAASANFAAKMPEPPGATKAVDEAAAEKKPTIGERVKTFLKDHKRDILLGGIGAYLGFALVGTMLGAVTGGLGFFLFFWLIGL